MNYRIYLIIAAFLFFFILQNSFFSHFIILGVTPNLILISLCILAFFENPHSYKYLAFAIFAGFLLDIFSSAVFGYYIVASLIVYLLIKKALLVLTDAPKGYQIVYFLVIFSLASIVFYLMPFIFYSRAGNQVFIWYTLPIQFLYNIIFAVPGFYLAKLLPQK